MGAGQHVPNTGSALKQGDGIRQAGGLAVTQAILTTSKYAVATTRDFCSLCKPRITALIVFTALAGALIAAPGMIALSTLVSTVLGIALVSSAAAAANALLERHRDAKMTRTRRRPLPSGRVAATQAGAFAASMALAGLLILYVGTNALTMWLTLASFFGYTVVYTVLLKPRTSQNIVLGGAAGAMPPVLGWSAVTGSVAWEPLLLFLIIFLWTPPHFWSLALYYRDDYAKGGFPMLPVTRGSVCTRLNILWYCAALALVSLVPYFVGYAAEIYFLAAVMLGAMFLRRSILLYRRYSDALALETFKFSIVYLFLLFLALIVDHYVMVAIH